MALPTLNSSLKNKGQNIAQEVVEDGKWTKEETDRFFNAQSSSVGVITFEALINAPRDYFSKYDVQVEKTVEKVQELMADTESDILAKVKENPIDKSIKSKAIRMVSTRISQYNNTPEASSLYNKIKKTDTNAPHERIVAGLTVNELVGLGPLEPLWQEMSVTEIICNGPFKIEVEIEGQLYEVEACKFRNADTMLDFINRLYKSVNKTVSRINSRVKGRLHDKSRMYAVDTIVAPEGPNFNIRKHNSDYVTPMKIIEYGTANEELMTDIGNFVHNGLNYLVVGGTGTGKTTMLNALTAFIPNSRRVITLEKNLEMKPHPGKRLAAPMETVEALPGAISSGVSMRDLVESATQMRPDDIYIGEVIDDSAYDLCQAFNTGHTGGSTVHANTADAAMFRMMSLVSQSDLVKERAAYDIIAEAFDIVITVNRFDDGSRKIVSVNEVANRTETDPEGNIILPTIPIWVFEEDREESLLSSKTIGQWKKKNELSQKLQDKLIYGGKKIQTWEQLCEVAKLPQWFLEEQEEKMKERGY